jgi:uncharacterized protein (TIGR00369 family)
MQGFNTHLGAPLCGMRGDEFLVTLEIGPQHLHDAGAVHGGVVMSLLDIAMSRAVRQRIGSSYAPTLVLHARFLASANEGTLFAYGRVLSHSAHLYHVTGSVLSSDERLLATASATMLLAI